MKKSEAAENTEVRAIRFYEFGEFRLDLRRRILLKNGEKIPLAARHFDLLLALIENDGRVVEHETLLDKVWEGMIVEESNLKKGISALRQIFGEESRGDFIKTVPRKGYSFVARVRALPDESVLIHTTDTQIVIEEIEEFDDHDEPEKDALKTISQTEKTPVLFAGTQDSAIVFFLKQHTLLLAAALGLIFIGGLAFVGWRFFALRTSAIDLSRMHIVPVTNLGNVGGGSISRNGEYLYYSTKERGGLSSLLWLKNLRTGEVRQFASLPKVNIYASAFAPDNESIYLWLVDDKMPARSGIYQISVNSGELRKITDKHWAGFRFSPDGSRVAYFRGSINEQKESGLFTANTDGGDEKLIAKSDGKIVFLSVDWSPDGRFLTYVGRGISENQYFIAQIPQAGGAEQIIVAPRPQPIFSAAWMPNGEGLIVTAKDESSKMQQVWHVGYPGGEWQRITNDLNWYWAANPTDDGKGIAVVQQRDVFNLWVGEADNVQTFRQITFDTVQYSPDLNWLDDETILFAATQGSTEIWEMSADGKSRRQITSDGGNNRFPQAAPDGQTIFFLSSRSGTTQIWQMRRDGGDAKQITNATTDVGKFKIFPDNRSIVYSMMIPEKGWTLFKKPIERSEEFEQLPFSDASPLWDISPDGKTIAYLATTKNGEKVRVSLLEENKLIKEFDFTDFNRLVWTKDGKTLLYDVFFNNGKEIFIQPLADGEAARPLTNFNSEDDIWNFDLSPSGKRIACRRSRQFLDVMMIKLQAN